MVGKITSLALITLAISACGAALQDMPMTRDRCEAQAGFVFVPAGEFIAGSDRPERDYGYAISAAAVADTPDAIAEAEQRLRDRRCPWRRNRCPHIPTSRKRCSRKDERRRRLTR